MSPALKDLIEKHRAMNERIAKLESDLAEKAKGLLDAYDALRAELATAYADRDATYDQLHNELDAEVHRKPRPDTLQKLEDRLSKMRFR